MKSIRRKLPAVTPIVLAIAAAFGTTSAAQAAANDPLGPPVLVTTQSESGPAIARNASGQFVIVWTDPSTLGIVGRRYASDGSAIDAIPLQFSHPASSNIADFGASVGIAANGDFVVSWLREPYGNYAGQGPLGIFARRYSSNGFPAGSELNLEVPGARLGEGAPSVAMNSQGDFVIAWERANLLVDRQDGLQFVAYPYFRLFNQSIVARRFNADGSAINQEPLIVDERPSVSASLQSGLVFGGAGASTELDRIVDVAIDDSGDFVVAWSGANIKYLEAGGDRSSVSLQRAGVHSSIYARSYDHTGKARLLPKQVATGSLESTGFDFSRTPAASVGHIPASAPSVAMDSVGNYVVSWSDFSYQSIAPVRARQFSGDGSPLSDELEFGTPVSNCSSGSPSVASDAGGNFVVAFQSCDFIIEAQRFTKGGAPAGGLFTVSTDSSHQSYAAVASDANGDFAVTWLSGDLNGSILARLFSSD